MDVRLIASAGYNLILEVDQEIIYVEVQDPPEITSVKEFIPTVDVRIVS